MPYYKPNGQPAFDSEFDSGGAGASLQQAAGNPAPDAASSGTGTAGPSPVPEFENIIGGVADVPGSSTPDPVTVTATTTQTITSSGSGLVFNNTFGSGATAAFINEVDAAETYLQSLFGNSCTVNCSFDLQSLNPNFSGENSFQPVHVSYSQFVNALKSHASTPTAVAAANALSNLADPTGGQGVEVPIGEALILGLPINTRINPDDAVVLNSVYWTPNALQNNPGDAEAVIEHEVTEGIMGRIGSLGIADVQWAPMDFFRYTASGQRDFTGGRDGMPTYFSADGTNVATGLQYHNSVSSSGHFDGFDFADWDGVGADSNLHDPFGPGGPGNGDPGTLSATDIQIMEALGWSPPVSSTAEMITHDSSNNYYLYDIGQNTLQSSATLGNLGANTFGGIGSFGGDRGDLMLRASNGDIVVYDISNNQITGMHDLGAVGLDWTIAGFGNFSGNPGETDMIMRQNSGALELYDISNNQVTFATSLGNFGSNTVAGFGDFSGNAGETDMMMRSASGDLLVYDMGRNSVTSGAIDLGGVGLDWAVYGFGDFSSNPNETDLIMRSTTTGSFELYDISNNRVVNAQALGAVGSEWTLAGFGDFSGNPGETDMMLRDSNTGGFETYDFANNRLYNASSAGQVTLSQTVSGVGPDVPFSDTSLSTSANTAAGSISANMAGRPSAMNAGGNDPQVTPVNDDFEIAPSLDSFSGQTSPTVGWVADAGAMNAVGWLDQPAAGAMNDPPDFAPSMSGLFAAPAGAAEFSPTPAEPSNAPATLAGTLLPHTG